MRAIENRRYLVRAANTGISGIVDPYGRVLQKTDIFVPAVLSGRVQWIDGQTVYTKLGDAIVYLSLAMGGIVLLFALLSGDTSSEPDVEEDSTLSS